MDSKKNIAQTFIDMGNKDGFDSITINKIIKACGISRSAFYYYFKDLPDVIDYYMYEKLSTVQKECAKLDSNKKGMEHYVKNVVYNFSECRKLMNSKWRIQTEKSLHKNLAAFAEKMVATKRKAIPISGEERRFMTEFITGGISYYILHGDLETLNAQTFAEQLYLFINGRYALMKNRN